MQLCMNVGFILSNAAKKFPDRTALIDGDTRLTFRALDERVNRLARSLIDAGVKKGDRIALMFYNSHHFVEVYFASAKIGAAVVPVNFRFTAKEVEYICNDSGSTVFFYGEDFHDVVDRCRPDLTSVERYIAVGAGDRPDIINYERFLASGTPEAPGVTVEEGDLCQIMYTSGTTGKPKGAMISHRAVLWNLVNTVIGREDDEGEIALVIGPMYHTAALNNHLTIQIAFGGACILVKRFDPATVLELIQKERATTISGSPAMYHLLLKYPEAYKYDTRSITKCTLGSSALPLTIKKQLKGFFPNIEGVYDIYGCTEAAPTITVLKAKDAERKEGSVGPAAAFVDVRIVDERDRPVPGGTVGELVCRGPNVMTGYYGREAETEECLRGGWLHTGDMAVMDDEGFITIVDRKKDVIISGGENIYPREVEEALLLHPDISEAAVIGVPDPLWGESVKAFVKIEDGAQLSEADVVEHCRAHLASYKKPKFVTFLDEIPRNPSGKILKRLLREMEP